MITILDKTVAGRKTGAEDIIIINLPIHRFRNSIPSRYYPPVDEKSIIQVALLAQVCDGYSFDKIESGRTDELHFWLRVASSNPGGLVQGADLMLPSMHWFALTSATSNVTAQSYLQTFGFSPLNLERIDLQAHGGTLVFPDGGRIKWSIVGAGKEPSRIGVNHVIFVAKDGQRHAGHSVAALLTDAAMEQTGKIRIQTTALEPFLLEGESFSAVIHRVPKLEADIVWRRHQA